MHPDVAARLAHETIDHRQPQTAAAAEGLGGIERLKDAMAALRVDAAACIRDFQQQELPALFRDPAGAHPDDALSADGILGILQEVQENLDQAVAVGLERGCEHFFIERKDGNECFFGVEMTIFL